MRKWFIGALEAIVLSLGAGAFVIIHTAINRAAVLSTIPLGWLGTADDVARTVAFLASDASSYLVGAEITVGGGFS